MNISRRALGTALALALDDAQLSKEDALRQIATTFNVQLQKRDSFRPANVNAPHPGEPTDYPLNKQAVYQLALANYDSAQRQRIADEMSPEPYTDQQLLDMLLMTQAKANNVRRPPVLQAPRCREIYSHIGHQLTPGQIVVLPLLDTQSFNRQDRRTYLRYTAAVQLRRVLVRRGLSLDTHTNPHDALIGTVVQPE
jgi:hypothetical protein